MGDWPQQGPWYFPCCGLAGTVYGTGLRRCLIIFAPQTLILDRRTCTCRTPSLQWIMQRSKNFTSGVAVSFTLTAIPSSPVDASPVIPRGTHAGGGARTRGEAPRHHTSFRHLRPVRAAGGQAPRCPGRVPRPAQLHKPRSVVALTFHGWTSSQLSPTAPLGSGGPTRRSRTHWQYHIAEGGRLEHTEFSTVSFMVGSGGGPWGSGPANAGGDNGRMAETTRIQSHAPAPRCERPVGHGANPGPSSGPRLRWGHVGRLGLQ